jgi:hypothetical protein
MGAGMAVGTAIDSPDWVGAGAEVVAGVAGVATADVPQASIDRSIKVNTAMSQVLKNT